MVFRLLAPPLFLSLSSDMSLVRAAVCAASGVLSGGQAPAALHVSFRAYFRQNFPENLRVELFCEFCLEFLRRKPFKFRQSEHIQRG